MRITKSRGKCLTTKEWIYGGLVAEKWMKVPMIVRVSDAGDPMYTHVIPDTVGLSTNRKDRYGEELFEGDIIKVANPAASCADIVTIVWDDQIAGFGSQPRIEYADWGWNETMTDHSDRIEKIGNIHDK